jgi:hypothetical protein
MEIQIKSKMLEYLSLLQTQLGLSTTHFQRLAQIYIVFIKDFTCQAATILCVCAPYITGLACIK